MTLDQSPSRAVVEQQTERQAYTGRYRPVRRCCRVDPFVEDRFKPFAGGRRVSHLSRLRCQAQPSLRHPGPYGLVFRAARELGHELAFGRKSQESLRRFHRLAPPVLLPDQQNQNASERFPTSIKFECRAPIYVQMLGFRPSAAKPQSGRWHVFADEELSVGDRTRSTAGHTA